MRQSLNLKLGQKLKLTPRLQQAIHLLQLSSLDLKTEIQTALENNPFLELDDEQAVVADPSAQEASDTGDNAENSDEVVTASLIEAMRDENAASTTETEIALSQDPVETAEDFVVASTESDPTDSYSLALSTRDSHDYSEFLENYRERFNVGDYLKHQLHGARVSNRLVMIAEILVDNLTGDGYLDLNDVELEALFQGHVNVGREEIEEALAIVQSLEPVGVGARNLKECLLIQLRQMSDQDQRCRIAVTIVESHFDLLSKRNSNGLMRATGLDQEGLADILHLIRSLDPRPGAGIDSNPPPYVAPDLVVRKDGASWLVELNSDAGDSLVLSPASKAYLNAQTAKEDTLYSRERYQEAKWLLQSLKQRNQTILRVGREIIRHQQGFLEHGESAMQPLTLKRVAETLELHESTVSRATSHKYILTPQGLHELKYFFSKELSNAGGPACSATSIQSRIRRLIAEEPAGKPISDQKIADYFKSEGIVVARRTVAKYREQMHIPPSSQRKGVF